MIVVDVWAVSWLFGLWAILLKLTFYKSSRKKPEKMGTSEAVALILAVYLSGVFFARITLALLRDFGVVA